MTAKLGLVLASLGKPFGSKFKVFGCDAYISEYRL